MAFLLQTICLMEQTPSKVDLEAAPGGNRLWTLMAGFQGSYRAKSAHGSLETGIETTNQPKLMAKELSGTG